MFFRTGDRVTIARPHPVNTAHRGKTGTVRAIDSDGYLRLDGIDRPVREKLRGPVACEPFELTKD